MITDEAIQKLKETYDSEISNLKEELESLKSQFTELEDYVVSINARLRALE